MGASLRIPPSLFPSPSMGRGRGKGVISDGNGAVHIDQWLTVIHMQRTRRTYNMLVSHPSLPAIARFPLTHSIS